MGRKPYKRIKLTDNEFNVVQKVAQYSKCGWFSIAGDTIDASNGKVVNKPRSNEYDECYDWETRHYTSLQFGIRLLHEAIGEDINNVPTLTDKEKEIWNSLLLRLK